MKQHFMELMAYDDWATRVYIDVVKKNEVSSQVNRLLSHVLSAGSIWVARLTGNEARVNVWEELPVDSYETIKENQYSMLQSILKALDNKDFYKLISYKNGAGEEFSQPIKDIFTHLANHNSYHRGQMALLLKNQIEQVPSTDFVKWARESTRNYFKIR